MDDQLTYEPYDASSAVTLEESVQVVLKGEHVTFVYPGGSSDTYVLRELVSALARFASSGYGPAEAVTSRLDYDSELEGVA